MSETPPELVKFEGKTLTPEIFDILKTYEGRKGFNLDIILKSNASGGHYAGSSEFRIVEIVQEGGPLGAFKAKVSIYDTIKNQWIMKKVPSSFFPRTWTPEMIEVEILSAYSNLTVLEGVRWKGVSQRGLNIIGYIREGIIDSAYPDF